MRIYGSQFRAWQGGVLAPADVIKMYEGGFAGVYKDPDEDAKLASYGYATADDALSDAGLVGTGAGKLSLPFLGVLKLYPGCLPGPAQRIGDCVTHGGKNAGLISLCSEVLSGKPDPVSGKLEVAPEVKLAGVRAGVLATEGYYHYRDHPDDGWTCSAIANVMVQHLGAIIRKDYGFADLTNYDPEFAKKFWKKSQIPREIYDAFDNNKFSDAATCRTLETVRDAVASGLGVNSCGGEGFSGDRDENGVMRRKGSWAHAMCYSSDTELLTSEGWKFVGELAVGDQLATLNPATHELEWQSAALVHEQHYSGDLLRFHSRAIDLLVTPNHRMYGIKQSRHRLEDNSSTGGPEDFEFVRADETSASFLVKRNAKWSGAHVLCHELPCGTRVPMNVWLEFLGYYLTEGSCFSREYARVRASGNTVTAKTRRVSIAQKKPGGVALIQRCLDQMPFKFRRINKSHRWDCDYKELHQELSGMGLAWEKRIPDYVWQCSREQLDILFHAMMAGDGSCEPGDNGRPRQYTTTSPGLADDFQRLLLQTGRGGKITAHDPTAWGKRIIYTVSIRNSHDRTKLGTPARVPYSGKVYCPTTRNGIVFARRDGKAAWCGNSIIGCDDRPETIREYRDPLFLVQNSWGKWGRGSRKIMGTQHEIPEGAFWARWSDIKNRTFIAIAGLNGWQRESIPDWLGGW